jgi:TolB-like protein/Tfp pilus assembly protein PilF
MKFIEGGQLDEVVSRVPMSTRQSAELIATVARTVHYAHEQGILHRDIKPGNILLDQKGEPHLTDFGLARLVETESTVTRTLEVLGTPSYMAPEQAGGNSCQGAAVSSPPNDPELMRGIDVYGLGAVLYQLLTSHPPFAGGTTYETIQLLLNTEPRHPRHLNPRIDRDLSTICLKCLEKDPQRRYPSAVALAQDLEHWLKHEPIQARRIGVVTRGKKWLQRNPTVAAVMMLSLALLASLGVIVWKSELFRAAPEKSIAVLPFQNSSREPDDAYFAVGVQDEILTDLARIADLKVISRTSTMQYKSDVTRNLRQIGRQLGVAHVVEGNVQRAANRLRVSAQLIDARNDRHLWAKTYDHELADVLTIQADVAQRIANELGAKLSPTEKAQMQRKPTENGEAYLAFVQAYSVSNALNDFDKLRQSEQLYERAIALDPNFALAIARYSLLESWLVQSYKRTERRQRAHALAKRALELQPELPEAHLARGFSYYYGYKNYDAALKEFEIAQRGLPNESEVYLAIGAIQRRQGKWTKSTTNLEKAVALNPNVVWPLQNLAFNYVALRNFKSANKTIDRVIALDPTALAPMEMKSRLGIFEKGDFSVAEKVFEAAKSVPLTDEQKLRMAKARADIYLLERKYQEGLEAAENLPDDQLTAIPDALGEKYYYIGFARKALHDEAGARAAFLKAKSATEEELKRTGDSEDTHIHLAKVLAYLGEKDSALAEAQRATELLPESKDALDGPVITTGVAQVYSILGDNDHAIQILQGLLSRPSAITVRTLKLDPIWDPLRSDLRFQKLCEEKQP